MSQAAEGPTERSTTPTMPPPEEPGDNATDALADAGDAGETIYRPAGHKRLPTPDLPSDDDFPENDVPPQNRPVARAGLDMSKLGTDAGDMSFEDKGTLSAEPSMTRLHSDDGVVIEDMNVAGLSVVEKGSRMLPEKAKPAPLSANDVTSPESPIMNIKLGGRGRPLGKSGVPNFMSPRIDINFDDPTCNMFPDMPMTPFMQSIDDLPDLPPMEVSQAQLLVEGRTPGDTLQRICSYNSIPNNLMRPTDSSLDKPNDRSKSAFMAVPPRDPSASGALSSSQPSSPPGAPAPTSPTPPNSVAPTRANTRKPSSSPNAATAPPTLPPPVALQPTSSPGGTRKLVRDHRQRTGNLSIDRPKWGAAPARKAAEVDQPFDPGGDQDLFRRADAAVAQALQGMIASTDVASADAPSRKKPLIRIPSIETIDTVPKLGNPPTALAPLQATPASKAKFKPIPAAPSSALPRSQTIERVIDPAPGLARGDSTETDPGPPPDKVNPGSRPATPCEDDASLQPTNEPVRDGFKMPVVKPIAEEARERLRAIFLQHNPQTVCAVDNLLKRYNGSEDVLYDRICRKYGVEPEPFSDPRFWPSELAIKWVLHVMPVFRSSVVEEALHEMKTDGKALHNVTEEELAYLYNVDDMDQREQLLDEINKLYGRKKVEEKTLGPVELVDSVPREKSELPEESPGDGIAEQEADESCRLAWKVTSKLEVYSVAADTWVTAEVCEIEDDVQMDTAILFVRYTTETGITRNEQFYREDDFLRPTKADMAAMKQKMSGGGASRLGPADFVPSWQRSPQEPWNNGSSGNTITYNVGQQTTIEHLSVLTNTFGEGALDDLLSSMNLKDEGNYRRQPREGANNTSDMGFHHWSAGYDKFL